MANGVTDLDLGDVMDMHGSATRFLDHDVFDITQLLNQSRTTDNVLFSIGL